MKVSLGWVLLLAIALLWPVDRGRADVPEVHGSRIRMRLRETENRLALERARHVRVLRALDRTTHALAESRDKLRTLRRQRVGLVRRDRLLSQREDRIERQLAHEREALVRLIQTRFILGREARLRFLLGGGSVSRLSRLLGEWRLVNRATASRLRSLDALAQNLALARSRLQQTVGRLRALEAVRMRTDLELEADRARRLALLAALSARMKHGYTRLDALRMRYRELEAMWSRLRAAPRGMPTPANQLAEAPFPRLRGHLPWPVQGTIVRGFGSPEAGGRLLSHGLLIRSHKEARVRAVAHGEVVFSGWLPNFGLIAVVAQGRGYYTVYAHNTVLYDRVGDWINAGDPIGRLGSGRGRRPDLYFQIRRGAEPIDPAPWLTPGGRPSR
ncbi:MAG: murein hydrolase activator EnvC family protein [Gammaproteobacteria bacterium]